MNASASLELRSAVQAHDDQLDTELRLLSELPQVYLTEKCVFDRGNGRIANKRGAICCLLCCGKQLDQKCNDLSGERAYPTVDCGRCRSISQSQGGEESRNRKIKMHQLSAIRIR